MSSSQTLSEAHRREIARWAAVCAERVVPLFDADAVAVEQVRDALERTRAFSAGQSTAADEIRLRMVAVKAASKATTPAGAAAARSVAQASAVAHMGAHALGAAGYAAKAVSLANPGTPAAVDAELEWQLDQLTPSERKILQLLPDVGAPEPGPLGPGLLASGFLGNVIGRLQASVK